MYLSPEQNRNVNFRERLFPLFFLKEGMKILVVGTICLNRDLSVLKVRITK